MRGEEGRRGCGEKKQRRETLAARREGEEKRRGMSPSCRAVEIA